MKKDYYWLITTISFIACIFLFTILAHAKGKIYEPQDPKYGVKKPYTIQQKEHRGINDKNKKYTTCLLYTSPSPRDQEASRMPSSA